MKKSSQQRVTILAGGVGGSKLVDGFARLDPPVDLTVIGNVGDDVERHGLWVSPDIDIVTYTLAGLVDHEKGWGFAGETFAALEALGRLGEETWMNLGDRDLATHIYRTLLRREGVRPTVIAERIASRLGAQGHILLPTDDPLQTQIITPLGSLNFQEYFLRERCEPEILDVTYAGAASAAPTPEALNAIRHAELLVIAPSNPPGSIGPILAVPGIREAILQAGAPRVVVCPLVGGQSLKGPSDRMLRAKGLSADPLGVADYYGGLFDVMVLDEEDRASAPHLERRGLGALVTKTIMHDRRDRLRLAQSITDHMSKG